MIKFISGDIFRTSAQYIAQGVATRSQEGLGTGLALKISQKWPDIQKQFKKYTRSHKFEGGNLFIVPPAANSPGLIYIATQSDMYRADIRFLNRGISKLAKYCADKG